MDRGRIHRGRPYNTSDRYCSCSSSPSSRLEASSETASTFLSYTVDGTHEFIFSGYSSLKDIGIGEYMMSDTFQVGGYSWAIYFYPNGKSPEDNAAFVSVFVALTGEGREVRALFELKMLDQSGRGRHKVHSHFERYPISGPYTLRYHGSMWGFKHFYRRTALDVSDYLKDDCLTIQCRVGVVRSQIEEPKVFRIPVTPSNIALQFGQLLESGKATDVNFEVDGETFSAHKLILATRSPVFKAQLFGPLKDDTDTVKVEDMEAPIFKALLHSIYWDSLPDMKELTGLSARWASTLMVQHLLAAADRYALDRLRSICEDVLCKSVAINTVATTLALAEQHNCFQLKAVCLKFIALPENLRAVMQTDGFEHLRISCPSILTELLEFVARVGEDSKFTSANTDQVGNGRRVKQQRYN